MLPRTLLLVATLASAAGSAAGSDWPQWRGPNRDNISTETGLLRSWPAAGPKVLWRTPVGEGYAGAAIRNGRIYLNDYDVKKKEHWVRCLLMADGKALWEWRYPVEIRPNHGITRTVPAVGQKLVFSLDPKCRLHALDALTGKLVWQKNLVQEYKATIPETRWRWRWTRPPARRYGERRTPAER
jgi:outer membrane protein assembly factor BamB